MPAVVERDLTVATDRCVLECAKDEVPVLTDRYRLIPPAYTLHDPPRKEKCRQVDGKTVEETRRGDVTLELAGHRRLGSQLVVAANRCAVGSDSVGGRDRVQVSGAVWRHDIVAVDEPYPLALRGGESGVACVR